MTWKILVIDDDPALLRVMKIGLSGLGYDVHTAANGRSGLSATALTTPDVVVLDLGLPDLDGIDICRRVREWTEVPIIVLSADATEDRKIEALDAGADDYVTKPFSMGELQARLRVALRRAAAHPRAEDGGSPTIDAGDVTIDFARHEARLRGKPLELTRREFDVLAYLARNHDRVCTQRMILEAVWGPRYASEGRYLREYAYRLRRKLGDEEGKLLRTRSGIGYQLVSQPER